MVKMLIMNALYLSIEFENKKIFKVLVATSSKIVPLISSRRNPLVKRLRMLSGSQGRKESSLLLLEGTHLLREALKTSSYPKEIIATAAWIADHVELLNLLPDQVALQEVTPSVLEAGLTTVSPDGVATLFPLEGLPKNNHQSSFILALDRLQDPGNLGTLLRTALAADVDAVWLASGADPLGSKVVRSSAGAILHLPYHRFGPSEEEAVEQLANHLEEAAGSGKQIVATLIPEASTSQMLLPYWELDWKRPTVLLFGNEGSGLHPLLEASCTHRVTLPHSRAVESLNVAAAAVPLLLERRRSKMMSDMD